MTDKQSKQLIVAKIKDGVVIDRIPPGRSLKVLTVLGIDETYPAQVSLAIKVPSQKRPEGLKDVLKIANKELTQEELDKLGLIIPGAAYNIIRDYKVLKKEELKLPSRVQGILKCQNPNCATNFREPIITEFSLISEKPLILKCEYCERFLGEDYVSQLLYGR